MKEFTRNVLRVSLCAIVVGAGVGIASFAAGARTVIKVNRDGIEAVDTSQQEERITESNLPAFTNIDVSVYSCDVTIRQGDSYAIDITTYVGSGASDTVRYTVDNGTLKLKSDSRTQIWQNTWYLMQFNTDNIWNRSNAVITIPKNARFQSVSLDTNTGDVQAEGVQAKTLNVDSHYGAFRLEGSSADTAEFELYSKDTVLTDFACPAITVDSDYGTLTLNNSAPRSYDFITMDNYSTDVTLRGIRTERLTLKGNYGNGIFHDIQSKATSLDFYSKDISGSGFDGGAVTYSANYGSFRFEDWTSQSLTGDLYSCDVDLAGKLGGKTSMDTQYGTFRYRTGLPRSQYYLILKGSYTTMALDGDRYEESLTEGDSNSANTIQVDGYSTDMAFSFNQ